jgi:hypothetical protein
MGVSASMDGPSPLAHLPQRLAVTPTEGTMWNGGSADIFVRFQSAPFLPTKVEASMKSLVSVFLLGIGLTAVAIYNPDLRAQVVVAQESSGSKSDSTPPQISGTTVGNTGCAVLEKHTPVKGPLLAIGVIYARTQYVVLDTFGCKLAKQKYTGPDDIKALNQTAVDDKIKLITIPAHYTDDQLQQAMDICKAPTGAQSSAPAAPAAGPAAGSPPRQ